MNRTHEYNYCDKDDLINKNFLFNKALSKLRKKYPQYHNVTVSFKKNEEDKTIILVDTHLQKYPEEIRKAIKGLLLDVYG